MDRSSSFEASRRLSVHISSLLVFALLVFSLLVLAAGCGAEEPGPPFPPPTTDGATCTIGSCNGCCQGAVCVSPPTAAACGSGGFPCTACSTGQTCNATTGSCQGASTCGAASCNGCCQANQCLGGKTDKACGKAGIFCVDCTLTSKTCNTTTGQCQGSTTTCSTSNCTGCCKGNQCLGGKTNTACGTGGVICESCNSGETCTNQTCSSTTPSNYKVTLVGAKLIASPWTACLEANCDMYVDLKVGSLTAKSTIKPDNNNPIWNEYLITASASQITSSFTATVSDDDYGPDNTVGTCTPTVTASTLATGKLVTKCTYTMIGDSVELTFTFQKQ